IDKEDYTSSDYVMEALNENVFQMIQFCKAHGGKGISDIVFYGEVRDYIKYTKVLEQQDVKTHILSVPSILSGYENFEFTAFANAIGAMYKRKKETERINLLDIDTTVSRNVDKGFITAMVGVFALCAVMVGGCYAYYTYLSKGVQDDIDEINTYISEAQDELVEITRLQGVLAKVNVYKIGAENAKAALASRPKLQSDVFNTIWECAEYVSDDEDAIYKSLITEMAFNNDGEVELTLLCRDMSYPADFVEELYKTGFFEGIVYSTEDGYDDEVGYEGFSTNEVTVYSIDEATGVRTEEEVTMVEYSITLKVKAGNENEN
ncbi:MAG: hypothetical protein WC900_10365, partial [Oscillospiraceae bacterium]